MGKEERRADEGEEEEAGMIKNTNGCPYLSPYSAISSVNSSLEMKNFSPRIWGAGSEKEDGEDDRGWRKERTARGEEERQVRESTGVMSNGMRQEPCNWRRGRRGSRKGRS